MDSSFMNASAWGAEGIQRLLTDPTRKFESVPLDRLLDGSVRPDVARSLDVAKDAFLDVVKATRSSSLEFMARLAVPLTDSDVVDLAPVDPDRLDGQLNEFSPPSLYLCRREMFLRPDP